LQRLDKSEERLNFQNALAYLFFTFLLNLLVMAAKSFIAMGTGFLSYRGYCIEHNNTQRNDTHHNDTQHNAAQNNDKYCNDMQHNNIHHKDIQYNNV
jgi:hypothetical protein